MNPAVLLVIGVVGGVGAAATYAAYANLGKAENSLTISDLRPAMPWEGLPLPVFFYTKPELIPKVTK